MRIFRPSGSDVPLWLEAVLGSIERLWREILPAPLRLWRSTTADLPEAADHMGALAWDEATHRPIWADGSDWVSPSLSTHGHAAAAVTFSPAGTIAATNVQAALAELDSEKAATAHGHAIADVTGLQAALGLKAPLASPALSGTPTAPTAAAGTNTTQIATTQYVRSAITDLVASSPAALDTLDELAAALGDDPNFATATAAALGNRLRVDTNAQGLTGTQQSNARSNLGLGTAATQATGTSGATVPLLNGNNIHSGASDFWQKLGLSGGAIQFPAIQVPSADANALDDYEEGTFTPNLLFGGANTGMTYTDQLGRYTKIGRLVFVEIRIRLSAKGSSTGSATIAGLPFTTPAVPNPGGACVAQTMNTVAMPVYVVTPSSTTISLYDFTGSTLAVLNDTDFNATSLVMLAFAYSV
ncbi:hypothetical protein [Sphingomonas parva]|uniref:hypothetical protein n=1 Tax=Sphingomonas parva TaxID=2555898 RepID=UPI001CDD7E55|nr:hypothetical protein [Sphingomonas parva]